jgi:hypothetical protein
MQINYGNLEHLASIFIKIHDLKLSSVQNLQKYNNIALIKSALTGEGYRKTREDIINKYAIQENGKPKDFDGHGQYQIEKDKINEFNIEYNQLMSQDVEIPFSKIMLEEIYKALKIQSDFNLDWNADDLLFLKQYVIGE